METAQKRNISAGETFPYSRETPCVSWQPNRHRAFLLIATVGRKNAKISGFIMFNDLQTADAFSENCAWLPLQAVSNYGAICKQTEDWLIQHQSEKENFVFYVVGSAELIVTLGRLLRIYGFDGSQIKSKGFWH